MAKTAKNEPTLVELLAAQKDAKAALDAELEAKKAEVAALEQQAADEMAEAQAALDAALAPYRAERDAFMVGLSEAQAARIEAVEPLTAKHAKALAALEAKQEKELAEATSEMDATIVALREQLVELTERVTAETGAPEVVFNMDIAPTKSNPQVKKGTKESKRTTPVVASLGVMGPHLVTTKYRRQDASYEVSCMYETRENEDGAIVMCASRVDTKGVIDGAKLKKAQEGEYTHCSTRAADVTTGPGWQPTRDVLFALCTQAGIIGNFPDYRPESELHDIFVDGNPLAPTPASAEVTIEETV